MRLLEHLELMVEVVQVDMLEHRKLAPKGRVLWKPAATKFWNISEKVQYLLNFLN